MFGRSKEKVPQIDRRRSLEGVPVRNDGVTVADNGQGRIKVILRRRRGNGFLARWQPEVIERAVKLDELGAFVFGLVDSRRTVLEIIDAFVERYRTNRREAELSTVAFLRSLVERGYISIAIR